MAIRKEYQLPSGRVVTLVMPDLYAILGAVGRVPSQQMVDVLNLLQQEGALSGDVEHDRFLHKRNEVRGMYAVAALCLEEPKLVLSGDVPEGALTPTDLTWADVEAVYWGFFRGYRHVPVVSLATSDEPDGTASDSRASEGVPDEARSADGAGE
jgi:hypothetical protein